MKTGFAILQNLRKYLAVNQFSHALIWLRFFKNV